MLISAFKKSGCMGYCNSKMHMYLQRYFESAAPIKVVPYLLDFLVKQKKNIFIDIDISLELISMKA